MDNNSFAVGYALGWKRGSDSGGGTTHYDDVYHDILTNSRQVYRFSAGIYSFGLNLWVSERLEYYNGAVWDNGDYQEDKRNGTAIAGHLVTDRRFNFFWVALVYKNDQPQYACLLMTLIRNVSGSSWANGTRRSVIADRSYVDIDGTIRVFTYRADEYCYDLYEYEITTAFTSSFAPVTAANGYVSLTGRVDINYPVRKYRNVPDTAGHPIIYRDAASDEIYRGYTNFTAGNYIYNFRPTFLCAYSDLTPIEVERLYGEITAYILEQNNGIPTDANSRSYLLTPSDADYHFPLT
jgi:hypothetical protein